MKNLFHIFTLSLILWSCENSDKVTITLENNSNFELTNCKVVSIHGDSIASDSIIFGSIQKKNQSTKLWTTKLPNSDGELYFTGLQNNKEIKRYFCYFSNGGFIQKTHTISIQDNEITSSSK
jgi:hypothetical protein